MAIVLLHVDGNTAIEEAALVEDGGLRPDMPITNYKFWTQDCCAGVNANCSCVMTVPDDVIIKVDMDVDALAELTISY